MKSVTWRRIGIFIAALVPMAWLVYRAATLQLGADPAKYIVLFTGDWAMYFLLATLAVTPLVRLCRWRGLMAHRRMLGLFSLFYALSHVAAYCVFILGLDFGRFFSELVKRPYISAGATGRVDPARPGADLNPGYDAPAGQRLEKTAPACVSGFAAGLGASALAGALELF